MGEISQALGKGSTLEFRGKTYPMAPLTYEVMGAFEVWLERQAWSGYRRAQAYLGPDELADMRKEITRDMAAHAYSFGGPVCAKSLEAPPGQKYMLFLLLKAAETADAEVSEKLVDEIHKTDWEAAMAVYDSVNADPNRQGRETVPASASPRSAKSSAVPPSIFHQTA